MELPKDPMMLFSVINMKLRDCYSSLDELCEDMNVDKDELVNQLKAVGFEYSVEHNKFWYSFSCLQLIDKLLKVPSSPLQRIWRHFLYLMRSFSLTLSC